MGYKTIFGVIFWCILAAAVLGDLPSCSRAKCSHCEAELIARLCPTACSGCRVTPLVSRVVAHGQPNIAGGQTELQSLPQAPVSAQPLPPPPQQQQQGPYTGQSPSYYSQPQNSVYQPTFPGSYQQQAGQPQNPFQLQQQPFQYQQQQQPGFGQTQSPFYNPFQPFLQQSYQAQTQYNPFNFPTFAPVSFPPVTQSPLLTPPPLQPQVYPQQPQTPYLQPQFPHAPTYAKVDGGSNQVQTPYQPQHGGQGQIPQQPQPQRVQPSQPQQTKPKQIYNTQTPPRSQPQAPYYPQPQVQQATLAPQPAAVYPAPAPPTSAPQPIPIPVAPQAPPPQTCPRPGWEPCISKELANERFHNCCNRLGEGCSSICSYDQSLATIQVAVLTGRCPVAKVAEMMICASGYEDATPCCEAYGVFEPGFEHCRPYCNPSAGLPNDGMLAEKFRCLGKMSQIQRCFYVTQRP